MTGNNANISFANENSPLHCAIVEFEDLNLIRKLIDRGADIRAKNHQNYKPLDVAIQNNNTPVAQLLIRRGALAGEDLNALLLEAIGRKNIAVVKTLIDHGIKIYPSIDLKVPLYAAISEGEFRVIEHILPHFKFHQLPDQYIPREAVMRCGPDNKECVQLLLKWNFIVGPESNHDGEFVYGAVKNGYLPIVLQLLKLGIDVNATNLNTGLNLLKVACLNKHHEIAEILLKHNAHVNMTTPTNYEVLNRQEHYSYDYMISSIHETNNLREITCLHVAVLNSDTKMTKLLLKYGAKIIDDPTFFNITRIAILRNCEEIVRMFLNYDLNVNSIDRRGRTLLHRCLHLDFTKNDCRYNIAKLLIAKGANVNVSNSRNSLLYEAIKHKHPRITQLLMVYGADIHYKSRRGNTLLHQAVESQFDVEFIKSLLKLNISVNAVNKDQQTPLHIACKFTYDDTLKTIEIIEALLEYNADINCTDNDLMTPLHFASILQKPEIVAMLLKNGANPNARNELGETPLHILCKQESRSFGNLRWSNSTDKVPSIIELLLHYNADIEAVDAEGLTPLFVACKTDHYDAIKFLLGKANVHCKDKFGNSIVHVIINGENEELIKSFASTQVNFNSINKRGNTPLHVAVKKKSVLMTKNLIKYGANLNILDSKKRTPLYNAIEYKYHYQRKLDNLNQESNFNRNPRPWDYSDYSDYDDENNYDSDDDVNIHRPLVCKVKKYQKIIKILRTHIIKLNNAGLKVNSQNWTMVRDFIGTTASDTESSDEDELFDEEDINNENVNLINDSIVHLLRVIVKCEQELEKMKTESIGVHSMTFHDLLTRNIHVLSKYVKNKKIRLILEQEIYDGQFPLYIDIIRSRFRDAKFRYRMLNSARKYFNLYVCNRLADDCVDTIFSFLDMKDLKVFVRTMKPLDK